MDVDLSKVRISLKTAEAFLIKVEPIYFLGLEGCL